MSRLGVGGGVVIVALALVAGVGVWRAAPEDATPEEASPDPEAVVVVDSVAGTRFATLAALTRAADVVVVGVVASVERGRVVATPGAAGIVSSVLTVDVERVLVGLPAPAGRVVVEEEGWLADGRRVAVDGARPVAPGDRGVWFLVPTGDPDLPSFVSVGVQGRYLEEPDGGVDAPDHDDPVVDEAGAATFDDLVAAVTAVAASG